MSCTLLNHRENTQHHHEDSWTLDTEHEPSVEVVKKPDSFSLGGDLNDL